VIVIVLILIRKHNLSAIKSRRWTALVAQKQFACTRGKKHGENMEDDVYFYI